MAKKETTKKLKEQKKQLEKNKKDKKNAGVQAGDPASSAPNGAQGTQAGGPAVSGDGTTVTMNINDATIDRSQLTADQITQAQLEEAIKESQDPSSRLKKLRSPITFKSCLLNLLILIVLTVGIVLLCCFFLLDRETFNLWVVIKDIFDKFGITKFFRTIGNWFKKVF